MRDLDYLVEDYQRLMHLAAVPGHILLSMTRKFVESTLHELLAFHGVAVDDSLNIEKLRDRLKKNPAIEYPLQKDAQVQTIQMFGNLSVHHKHEPIDSNESWKIVYPALSDYTKWLFREVFDICEEFDDFEPMELSQFAQYGFRVEEGIFRLNNGKGHIQSDELEHYRAVMGTFFANLAPEMSSILRTLSQVFTKENDFSPEMKTLVLDCMILTAWWAPFAGLLAMMSESDRKHFSQFSPYIEDGSLDFLIDAMNPTSQQEHGNLDPNEWA